MRRALRGFLISLLCGCPLAFGEVTPERGSGANAPVAQAPPLFPPAPLAPPPLELESGAQQAYQAAFALMTQRRWSEAAASFDALVAQYPESAEAPVAGEMARLAHGYANAPDLELRQPELGESKLDRGGRPELLITTTLFGIWTGIAISVLANLQLGSIVLSGLTGLAGFGAGLWATSEHPISVGGASLISTGVIFGTTDAAMLSILAGVSGNDQVIAVWVGTAVGGVGALVVQAYLSVSSGQVALVTGGGLLGVLLAGLVALGAPAGTAISGTTLAGAVLALNSAGLIAAAVSTHWFHPTRGRIIFTELGGILGGALVGGSIALAAPGDNTSIAVGSAIGVLFGAGAVLAFSSGMNELQPGEVSGPSLPGGAELLPPMPFVQPGALAGASPAVGIEILRGCF